jgi:hypothetical protein
MNFRHDDVYVVHGLFIVDGYPLEEWKLSLFWMPSSTPMFWPLSVVLFVIVTFSPTIESSLPRPHA